MKKNLFTIFTPTLAFFHPHVSPGFYFLHSTSLPFSRIPFHITSHSPIPSLPFNSLRHFYSYNKLMNKDLTEETLSSFPDEILDVFKARVKRKFTHREDASIKDLDVLNILQRVKTLMNNLEFKGGRSATLETNS